MEKNLYKNLSRSCGLLFRLFTHMVDFLFAIELLVFVVKLIRFCYFVELFN
jgi:hypothetical protein